jgi:hypothetical protein
MSAPGGLLRASPGRPARTASGVCPARCAATTYWRMASGAPLKVVEAAATAEIC